MSDNCCGSHPLSTLRHSAAHVMAHAVQEMWPDVKIAIGPAIEDGFYYDFDKGEPFTTADLAAIEERMGAIVEAAHPFVRSEVSRDEALSLFESQPYKIELIEGLPADEQITTYADGGFVDLCRGPHVSNTGEIRAFKLLSVAGAYWRGDSSRPMLQRIYGTAFETREELEQYLERVEEARKRDHKRLGRELELFTIIPEIGAGLPVWLPKGATIRRVLEEYILKRERDAGYQHVYTPHLASQRLYEISGHWQHYQDGMYPPMEFDNERLVLRPMNCPHHFMIYKQNVHSYRELPIRIAELGTMYRYEQSGELTGLSRVRAMTLNDAHIFLRPEQIQDEVTNVLGLIREAYEKLGFDEYWFRLSLRDPADHEKYVDNDAMWDLAEDVLKKALDEAGIEYEAVRGEAAFYGPKIDVQVPNVMGKDETEYIGEDNQPHRPVVIHRGVISTMERIVAFLIERYAGAFPLWLAPVQAVVLPIADRHVAYGERVLERLKEAGFRANLDSRNEKVGYKIREAQLQKVPFMLIVGDREVEAESVSVRSRDEGDLGAKPLSEFIAENQDRLT